VNPIAVVLIAAGAAAIVTAILTMIDSRDYRR
jgi:hypothetical protein